MRKLAPSLLAADFSRLKDEIRKIERAGAHYLHLDVMDGHFVPNISFGIPVIQSIREVTNMTFDVHLMIENPDRYIEAFAGAGADIINVHIEACQNIKETIAKIKSADKRAAVTVSPATDISRVYDVLAELDMVLIMSVEPGFGGQEILPHIFKKAEKLANHIANEKLLVDIEMDGGIDLHNVRDVLSSGVKVVVVGSAIFKAEDPSQAVKDFYEVFRESGV